MTMTVDWARRWKALAKRLWTAMHEGEERIDLLVKAGALIAAEIDRLRRSDGHPELYEESEESEGGDG